MDHMTDLRTIWSILNHIACHRKYNVYIGVDLDIDYETNGPPMKMLKDLEVQYGLSQLVQCKCSLFKSLEYNI